MCTWMHICIEVHIYTVPYVCRYGRGDKSLCTVLVLVKVRIWEGFLSLGIRYAWVEESAGVGIECSAVECGRSVGQQVQNKSYFLFKLILPSRSLESVCLRSFLFFLSLSQ